MTTTDELSIHPNRRRGSVGLRANDITTVMAFRAELSDAIPEGDGPAAEAEAVALNSETEEAAAEPAWRNWGKFGKQSKGNGHEI